MMSESTTMGAFSLGFSADLIGPDGKSFFGNAASDFLADYPHVRIGWLEQARAEIGADQLRPFQAAIIGGAKVTQQSVCESESLLALARLGVGYETVDVQACTNADVLVTITAGAVDRPMAEATVMWMLALSHNLRIKDQLVRKAQWDRRSLYHGCELRDRTFGAVGLGRIARKVVELLRGFGMNRPISCDPYVDAAQADALGVKLVGLNELMAEADFVSIHCPLTDTTRNRIGAQELALMKPTAYLINTARGGIVDEEALYDALKASRIAGAAMDCFAVEPVTEPHPLSRFDNVLLAPHAIGWTHELFRDMAVMACQSVVDLSRGERPHGVVNPEVLDRPGFVEKWQRLRVSV